MLEVEARLRVVSSRMRGDFELPWGCDRFEPVIGVVVVAYSESEGSRREFCAWSREDCLVAGWMEVAAFLFLVCGCSGAAAGCRGGKVWGAAAAGGEGSWGGLALLFCVAGGCVVGLVAGDGTWSTGLGVAVLSIHPASSRYSASLMCCCFFESRALE